MLFPLDMCPVVDSWLGAGDRGAESGLAQDIAKLRRTHKMHVYERLAMEEPCQNEVFEKLEIMVKK